MNKQEWSIVHDWYQPLLGQFPGRPEAVGWNPINQKARFSALTSRWDLSKSYELLDVGCGLAHLHDWLIDSGYEVGYKGVDCLEEMVSAANSRIGQPLCTVMDAEEALPACDYAVASGLFNLRFNLGSEDYGLRNPQFMQNVIRRMFTAARRGIAFDCLTDSHPNQVEDQFYYNAEWLSLLVGELSPSTIYTTDGATIGLSGNAIFQIEKLTPVSNVIGS